MHELQDRHRLRLRGGETERSELTAGGVCSWKVKSCTLRALSVSWRSRGAYALESLGLDSPSVCSTCSLFFISFSSPTTFST